MMPVYLFNVHDGVTEPDIVGTELASIDDAKREAMRLAADLIYAASAQRTIAPDWHLDVVDGDGQLLFRVAFELTELS